MSEHGDAYRGARARLTALAKELDDSAMEQIVPTCPEWRVKDVYGHLIGLSADVLGRNTEGAGTDEWTAAQVDARRGWTCDELLAEWDEKGSQLEALIDKLPATSIEGIVGDIATHEADINGALGRSAAHDSDAVKLGIDRYVRSLATRVTEAGLPALSVNGAVAGDGDPAASVKADSFEMFRALTGRRSADQVRAFAWSGDAEPYVAIFSAYGVPEAPVVE